MSSIFEQKNKLEFWLMNIQFNLKRDQKSSIEYVNPVQNLINLCDFMT